MNQKAEFSEFISKTEGIIDNGRSEAKANKGSLERMRFAAIRQDRTADAESIATFLGDISNEIAFFRKAAGISSSLQKRTLRQWLGSFKPALTPSTFSQIDEMLPAEKPFSCVEGVFVNPEKSGNDAQSTRLKGPFFIAVAANFSGAVSLNKGNLVCLFSQAAKAELSVELRIWNTASFCGSFSGKSFDQSILVVPPDSNETILKLHRGIPSELFKIAALKMAKSALGHNPPDTIAEQWIHLLKEYGETQAIPALK